MKTHIILLFCILCNGLAHSENSNTIDFSSVKPLHEIPSYRAANPSIRATGKAAVSSSKFNSRIVNGQIAGPEDVPYQVKYTLLLIG